MILIGSVVLIEEKKKALIIGLTTSLPFFFFFFFQKMAKICVGRTTLNREKKEAFHKSVKTKQSNPLKTKMETFLR